MILKIILKNILKNKVLSIITIITLFISISFSLTNDMIYGNIKKFLVIKNIGKDINEKRFIILRGSTESTFFGKNKRNIDGLINDLEKDKNIEKLQYIYRFNIPTMLKIDLLGVHFQTDTFTFAVSDELITNSKIKKGKLSTGISGGLLDIYNLELANSGYFPKLSPFLLKTINFNIVFGKSSFFEIKGKSFTKKGKITSVNNQLPIFGISIPLSEAKKILKELGSGDLEIHKIIAYAKNKEYIERLQRKYPNYTIKTDNDLIKNINKKTSGIKAILSVLNYIIWIVVVSFLIFLVINIINKNKKTIKIFHIHGASRVMIAKLLFFELSFYLFVSIFLLIGLVILLNQIAIPYANDFLENKLYLGYQIIDIGIIEFLKIIFIYGFVIYIVGLITSYKTIRKKFMN